MVRVLGHLWLATSAGGVRGLPTGVTTLVLVTHVTVAALVILVAFMAVFRGRYPWEMRKEAVYLAEQCKAEGGDMRDAVMRLRARAKAAQWPWPRNPFSFIHIAQAIALHSMLNVEGLCTLLGEPAHHVCMLLRWHLLPCFM